jgi:PAS domain S-box-containing protein
MHQIPIWILDSSAQNLVAANNSAAELFGYSSDELRGMKIVDLLDPTEHVRFYQLSALARQHWGEGGSWLCRTKSGVRYRVTIRFHGIVRGSDIALFMFATQVSGHPSFLQAESYRVAQAR